jgi:hypothetical protein
MSDNLPQGGDACPPDKLVAIDITVDDSMRIVRTNIMKKFPIKVPPLCISRFSKGGKTTILRYLFERLKADGFSPIIVSFNGNFKAGGDSVLQAFCGHIAMQFVDQHRVQSSSEIYCEPQNLIEWITATCMNRPVVLLIDELNQISVPLHSSVSEFLKRAFLDVENRYLIFTTHVPLVLDNVNTLAILGGSSSVRLYEVPTLPLSKDWIRLNALIHTPESITPLLTPLELAMYGCIPSLIYTVKCLLHVKLMQHFDYRIQVLQLVVTRELVGAFVKAVLNGSPHELLRPLEQFSSVIEPRKLVWPLYYIKAIMNTFTICQISSTFNFLFDALQFEARKTEHGIDWELIIQLSLYFRCCDAMLNNSNGPFEIASSLLNPSSDVTSIHNYSLAASVKTLEQAHNELLTVLKHSKRERCLIIATPSFSKFPDLDGMILYVHTKLTDHATSLLPYCNIYGYQCKAGRAYPRHAVPDWIQQAYLIRGKSPANQYQKAKWTYLNAAQVQELVGYSLQDLIPDEWPDIPEEEEEDADEVIE